jgi:hypothetical protein
MSTASGGSFKSSLFQSQDKLPLQNLDRKIFLKKLFTKLDHSSTPADHINFSPILNEFLQSVSATLSTLSSESRRTVGICSLIWKLIVQAADHKMEKLMPLTPTSTSALYKYTDMYITRKLPV